MIRFTLSVLLFVAVSGLSLADAPTIVIDETKLTISPSQNTGEWSDKGQVEIPRVYASLRDAHWTNNQAAKVTVHPEIKHWEVRWDSRPQNANSIELHFDQPIADPTPITQAGDATITLRADQAEVHAELLRYEPQPHKNTVGYWANPDDWAHWNVVIDQPGTFNIGVLQGCGKDQGGSIVSIQIERDGEAISAADFTVEETGHFQNFIWRNIGELSIKEPGNYHVTLRAKKVANKAVGDFRMLHLSPKR